MRARDGRAKNVAHTDRNGYAEFWLVTDATYDIDVEAIGFKRKRLNRLRLAKPSDSSPTAYVQLRLELSGPFVTVE